MFSVSLQSVVPVQWNHKPSRMCFRRAHYWIWDVESAVLFLSFKDLRDKLSAL